MLVLTRKPGQAVCIGDIRIVVTRVNGNQVRLGFKTPAGMRAYREEIYDAIRSENMSARLGGADMLAALPVHGYAQD